MKKCPYCSEEIQNTAKKCKHCGEWLKKNDIEENKNVELGKTGIKEVKNKKEENINKISKWKIIFYIIGGILITGISKVAENTVEGLQMFFMGIAIIFLCKSHSNLLKRKMGKNIGKIWEYIHFTIAILAVILFVVSVGKAGIIENPAIIFPFFIFGYFYNKDNK